jgi:hypothetical protein
VNNIFLKECRTYLTNILNYCCETKSAACFNGKNPQKSEDLLSIFNNIFKRTTLILNLN